MEGLQITVTKLLSRSRKLGSTDTTANLCCFYFVLKKLWKENCKLEQIWKLVLTFTFILIFYITFTWTVGPWQWVRPHRSENKGKLLVRFDLRSLWLNSSTTLPDWVSDRSLIKSYLKSISRLLLAPYLFFFPFDASNIKSSRIIGRSSIKLSKHPTAAPRQSFDIQQWLMLFDVMLKW